jgi:hypothetical protein
VVRAVAGPNKPLWVEPIPNEVSASMTSSSICVLTRVLVLPKDLDTRAPAFEYGVCATLVRPPRVV